eukprot:4338531-Pyramimonas_sp.AAC.1
MKRTLMVLLPQKIREREIGEGVHREPAVSKSNGMTNTEACSRIYGDGLGKEIRRALSAQPASEMLPWSRYARQCDGSGKRHTFSSPP